MDSVTRPEAAANTAPLIVRNPQRDHWTVIDNVSLRDTALSWQATGMLAYLVSLPDDWRVNIEDLINRKRDGRTATRSALNELVEAGYVEKRKVRGEGGRIVAHEIVVHEVVPVVVRDRVPPARKPSDGLMATKKYPLHEVPKPRDHNPVSGHMAYVPAPDHERTMAAALALVDEADR